ncbi:unnamed protein product, partial [Closterium sp. NIES-54]
VARSSTTLPCSAILPGFLTGLYIPSFSPNLVGVGYLQDHGITITFPAHGRTAICTAASTGALLATFNREPHSGLFVLHTASHQVAESGQVTASPQVAESGQVTPSPLVAVSSQVAKSGLVAASCSFRFLAHPTVLWHHRLGHPSIPRLRSMASHRLVSGLPHVFASLLRGSATFWWSSTSTPGISQPWTLSKSPQQNGVAERCIGLVMDIARTSMIHARAPHFLWPYAVRYVAHRLNLQPHVSRPEASPTSLWTGSPGIESAFCVLGCLALVHETSVDKLSARAIPCVFLGFLVDSPDYAFYHPPLHQFLDSRDVRFDETVSYYARYLCRGLLVPAPPFFLAPSPPPAPAPLVSPPPLGPALSGVSHATPLPSVTRQVASPSPQSSSHSPQQPSALPRQVPVNSGGVGAGGAATGGTRSGGALLRGDGVGGAGTGGASLGGAGAGGAGARGASFGGEWASQWKVAMNSELASWRSTGTYVDVVPPPRANVVDSMWLFKVLRRFEFQFSTTQPTPLPVDHRLTGPFPDEPFDSSGPYAKLVGYLIVRLRVNGSILDAGAVSWRSTRLSSVASSSVEAEIYAGAMAAQELRWLTFLLADFGERPRSAPTLYADNKAMILLCREPRLESRVKHIDVRYFLLRELQQRGQARLDFVASEANTADVFTKALAPGDHLRYCVQLGLVEVGPRLL